MDTIDVFQEDPAMKKTLYLHIGAHKTGTTALQHFLSANREILKNQGYLYPGNDYAHHDMAHEFSSLSLPEIRKNRNCATRRFFNEINSSHFDTIIMSSEDFENMSPEIPFLKEFLSPDFHVKIIYYVRRQDDKLESTYSEYVKSPVKRYDKPISVFIKEKTGQVPDDPEKPEKNRGKPRHSDYYSILMPWCEAFGRNNIIVRCYEKEQLPEGIYHDFLDAVGLVLNTGYWIPKTRFNESLNIDLLEMIRLCNARFNNNSNFHRFLLGNLTQINSKNSGIKQHYLSPAQRREIITIFEESNARIAREYLGRCDGRLFYAPLPDSNEPWEPNEGLTAEKTIIILSQILFNIDRQMKQSKDRTLRQKLMQKIITTSSRIGLLPAMSHWYHRFRKF